MANDPITLIVALDKNQKAKGHLYIDDGKSFNYKTKEEFVLIEFDFSNDKLTGHLVSKPGFECKSWLERVIVMGYDKQKPVAAKIVSPTTGEETLKTSLSDNKVLTVRRPGVNICSDWELTLWKNSEILWYFIKVGFFSFWIIRNCCDCLKLKVLLQFCHN